MFFFFFFSSRRRHTRCSRDWSSDVCSSDLASASVLATSAVSALTNGMARLPDFVAASAREARSKLPALQAFVIGPAALAGITPVATSARARAASKSSICWRHAASSQTTRMAELDNIGASRGEGTCSCCRDIRNGIALDRLVAQPGAAIVQGDNGELPRQCFDEGLRPSGGVQPVAHDQHERRPPALHAIGDMDAVYVCMPYPHRPIDQCTIRFAMFLRIIGLAPFFHKAPAFSRSMNF